MTGFAGGVFLRSLRATSPKGISSGSSCALASCGPSSASSTMSSINRIPENRNMRKADDSPGNSRKKSLAQFYGEIGRTETKQENVGNSTKGGKRMGARRRNGGATGARARTAKNLYSSPCDRKRVTGSTTGSASRRKIQRATAKPTAA